MHKPPGFSGGYAMHILKNGMWVPARACSKYIYNATRMVTWGILASMKGSPKTSNPCFL
jgi:hypothetical protein